MVGLDGIVLTLLLHSSYHVGIFVGMKKVKKLVVKHYDPVVPDFFDLSKEA